MFQFCLVIVMCSERKREVQDECEEFVIYISIYIFYVSIISFLFVYLFVHLFLFLFFAGWMLKIQHETHNFVMCLL